MIKAVVGADILILKQRFSKSERPSEILNGYEGARYTNLFSSAKIGFQNYSIGILRPDFRVSIEEAREEVWDFVNTYRPKVILTLGQETFTTLTGLKAFEAVRGTFLTDFPIPILPTYDIKRIIEEPPMEYVTLMDCRKVRRYADDPTILDVEKDFEPDATLEQMIHYMKERKRVKGDLVLDIENTYGPETHITQVGLSHSPDQGITFNCIRNDWGIDQEVLFWSELASLLEDPKVKLIMQNGKHDLIILWKNRHILCNNFYFDTLIAGQLCWPELKKSLAFLSSLLLHVPAWKHDSANPFYNVQDVANTFGIYIELKKMLEQKGIYDFFLTKMEEVPFACRAEMRGLKINKELLKVVEKETQDRYNKLELAIRKLTEEYGEYNLNSPKQLQELLYTKLKLPAQYKRRKSIADPRKLTTDSEALLKLADKTNHPVLLVILEAKKVKKRLSYFKDFRLSPEGKVHTSFNIDSAKESEGNSLGRWSSSGSIIFPFGSGKQGKLNIQSIPRTERYSVLTGKMEPDKTRNLFITGTDNLLVNADYAQAEAVFIAYYSSDHDLIEIINSHGDMHKRKVSELTGIEESLITPEQRQMGKILRHGSNYKGGPEVIYASLLSAGLKTSRPKCKELFKRNLEISKPLLRYHEGIELEMKSKKFLVNCFGRKRYYLGKIDDRALKNGYAFKPQSGVGDMLNIALKSFYKLHGETYDIWFPVHDSILVECKISQLEQCKKDLLNCMVMPITINGMTFELGVDFKTGKSWGELK